MSKDANSITTHEFRRVLKEALAASALPCASVKAGPRFNLAPGAQVGQASSSEYADICLSQEESVENINLKLSPFLKGGFRIEEIKEVPYSIASVENLASYAKYLAKGISGNIEKTACAKKIEVEVEQKNGMRLLLNIRPFIYSIKQTSGLEEVEIIVKLEVLRSIGLGQILAKLPGLEVKEKELFLERIALLWQAKDGSLLAV